MPFCLSHSNPDPAFQPIAKTHDCARDVFIIIHVLFISAVLPRSRAITICPAGMKMHEKEKQWGQCSVEVGFSCETYNFVSCDMC